MDRWPALDAFPLHFCKFGGVVWIGGILLKMTCELLHGGEFFVGHCSNKAQFLEWLTSFHLVSLYVLFILSMRAMTCRSGFFPSPSHVLCSVAAYWSIQQKSLMNLQHLTKCCIHSQESCNHGRSIKKQQKGPKHHYQISGQWVWYRRLQRLWRWYVGFPSCLSRLTRPSCQFTLPA